MINVIFNKNSLSVRSGTRVIDLIDKDSRRDFTVCRVGSRIKELAYILTERNEGMEIMPIGIDFPDASGAYEAGKAYEATLRFCVAMAFYNLYPDVRVRFSYNVSRSIFCQAVTPGFNMFRAAEPIRAEVQRIVNADLPIERITISKAEAEEIYDKYHYSDKKRALKYRPDDTVHMYRCGNYYDYLFAYMAPSTGCLKNYIIEPYSPGLIIRYPRYELGAEIPAFVEEPTYGRTLQNAYLWSKKTDLQTVADINAHVEENVLDFVQMCEAKHSNMLSQLGSAIEADIHNIRLIGIAGPSSSGKTTFCNRLRIELLSRGINPVMISMDDYYLTKERISEIQGRPIGSLDLEHINCLDTEAFNKDLFELINGEEVTLPYFNFKTGKRERGRTIRVGADSPIIIEGIHALNEKLTSSIPKHQKYKIYIAPQAQMNIDDHAPLSTTDLRLIRRIVRDMKYRGSPAAQTIDMWQSVRSGEFKWIYPNQEGANFVFNSCLQYELCVLRTEALPALRQIKPADPQYLVANRLIKYLKYFTEITDDSIIPCNSLIREFIGGSCFKL